MSSRRRVSFLLAALALLPWLALQLRAAQIRFDSGEITLGVDFAYFLQVFENLLHGRGSGSAILDIPTLFADNFRPAIYLISLVYAGLKALSDPWIAASMLAPVSVAVTAVLILFRYRYELRASLLFAAGLIAVIYLNSHGNLMALQGPRISIAALPAILWLCWAFQQRATWSFLLASILTISFRLDFALLILGFALPAILRRDWLWVGMTSGAAMLLGFLALFVHMSASASGGPVGFVRFQHLGATPMEAALSPLLRPAAFFGSVFREHSARFALELLSAYAFLPLLRPSRMLPFLPYFVFLCLNGEEVLIIQSIGAYYSAPFLPPLLLASAEGLLRLSRRLEDLHSLLVAAPLLAILSFFLLNSAFYATTFPAAAERSLAAEFRLLRGWLATQTSPSLSAPGALLPYLADLPHARDLSDTERDGRFLVLPANLRRSDWLPSVQSPAEYQEWIYERSKVYRTVFRSNDLVVFDRQSPADSAAEPIDLRKEVGLIDGEFGVSERAFVRLNWRDGAATVRAVGIGPGIGWPVGLRGYYFLTGPYRFAEDVQLNLRIRRADSVQCRAQQTPRLIVQLEDGRTIAEPLLLSGEAYQTLPIPLLGTANTSMLIGVQSRGCGLYFLDWISLGRAAPP